ncbi:hypothetical protein Tco_0457828 [Tanacetum coccineum]
MCYRLFLGFLRAIHEQGVSRGALYRASPQLCENFEHNVAAQDATVLLLQRQVSVLKIEHAERVLTRPSGKTSSKTESIRSVHYKYRVDELNEPPLRCLGIRSLLPLPGRDPLTGSTDLKIRRWDHCSPERTYCISGSSVKGVGNDEFSKTKSRFGVQVV